jgi:hypothetical protein
MSFIGTLISKLGADAASPQVPRSNSERLAVGKTLFSGPSGGDTIERTLASIIGDIRIPPLKGKMIKRWIQLPDHSWIKVRISRRQSPPE